MPFLVPTSDTANSLIATYGSGSSFADRMDNYPSSDDATGAVHDWLLSGTAGLTMRLGVPAGVVDTAAAVQLICRAGGFVRDANSGTITVGLTLTLYEGDPALGGVVRAAVAFSRGQVEVYSDTILALTVGEKAAISDWSNLYVQFGGATKSGTGDMLLRMSEVALDYAVTSGGGTRKRSHLTTVGSG